MSKKSTNAELILRVDEILNLILKGYNYREIIRHGSENWGITSRATDEYIKKAKVIIDESAKETRDQWIKKAKMRLEKLYKKNYEKYDYAECRQIINTANKVLGYERLNLNLSGEITVNQLDEMMETWIDKTKSKTKKSDKRTNKPKV